MKRTRRAALTVAAATGLLGAAGGAAVTVSHLNSTSTASTPSPAAGVEQVAATSDDGRAALQDYIARMSADSDHLAARLGAAQTRLARVQATRARLVALARAKAAAEAAAARAEAAAAVSVAQPRVAAPATHTSTGASSSGGEEHGDDEHEGHGDDGHEDDD